MCRCGRVCAVGGGITCMCGCGRVCVMGGGYMYVWVWEGVCVCVVGLHVCVRVGI